MWNESRFLRVGVDINSPYVNSCVLDIENCPDPGIVFQLFLLIMSLLHWHIQLPIRPTNASVTGGLIDMLKRNEIDVVGSLMPIPDSLEELKSVEYSLPITTLEYGFVVLSLPHESNPLWNLFVPFSHLVWMYVAVTTIVVQLVFRWFLWLSSKNQQFGYKWSKRFLFITKGFLFLFLILKFYRSNLYKFFVASDPPERPFDSYEEFATAYSKGEVKFAVWDYSALADINKSTIPVDKLFQSHLSSNPVLVIPEDRDMYRTVANTPDLTFRTSFTSYQIKTSNWRFQGTPEPVTYCNLSFVPIRRTFQAFAFPKGSPLLEPFNRVLYANNHSAEQWDLTLVNRKIPPKRCGSTAKPTTKKYFPLGINMLSSSLFMWIVGLAICFVSFLQELVIGFVCRIKSYRLANS